MHVCLASSVGCSSLSRFWVRPSRAAAAGWSDRQARSRRWPAAAAPQALSRPMHVFRGRQATLTTRTMADVSDPALAAAVADVKSDESATDWFV